MGNRFEQFTTKKPNRFKSPETTAPAQVGIGEDMARSAVDAIPNAAAHILGAPVDLANMALAGTNWLGNKAFGTNAKPFQIPIGGSEDIKGAVGDFTGEKLYKSQTEIGQATGDLVDSGIQGGLTGPAGGIKKMIANAWRYGMLPRIFGEAGGRAGEAAFGPDARPWAEFLASIGAGGTAAFRDRPPKAVRTVKDMKKEISSIYKDVGLENIVATADSYGTFVNDIGASASKLHVNPKNHPGTAGLIEEIASLHGAAPDLQELDQIRQIANDVIIGDNPGDARLARIMKGKLDEYITGLEDNAANVMHGNMTGVPEKLAKARAMRVRQSKMEIIEKLFKKARNSQQASRGNFGQAIRNQFRKLADNDILDMFSPAEQEAIDKAVNANTPERWARAFATLNPEGGRFNFLMAMGGAGALGHELSGGNSIATGAATMSIPVLGVVGQQVENAMTTRQAHRAQELIAGGATRPPWIGGNVVKRIPVGTTIAAGVGRRDDERRAAIEGRRTGGRVERTEPPVKPNRNRTTRPGGPTEAQKVAGNYQKHHITVHGMPISIETPKGQLRSGKDSKGKPWRVKMPAHYGYIKRTMGADGAHLDAYVGDHASSKVFVVNQVHADTGKFDEHKIMLGFPSKTMAVATYNKGFSDGKGPQRNGGVKEMTVAAFHKWKEKNAVPA